MNTLLKGWLDLLFFYVQVNFFFFIINIMNAISKSLKMLRQSKVYRFYIKKIPETSHPQIIALNSIISGVGTANKISKLTHKLIKMVVKTVTKVSTDSMIIMIIKYYVNSNS